MNPSFRLFIVLLTTVTAAACESSLSIDPVMVAAPGTNSKYDETYVSAAKEDAAKCFQSVDAGVAFVHADQPLVIRHKLADALDAAQQQLSADLVLETVCERRVLEDVAYGTDSELVKPLLAPPGSQCGLRVVLRVADAESRCDIPADSELCGDAAKPCAQDSEGDSTSGSSSGADGSDEVSGGTTDDTGG